MSELGATGKFPEGKVSPDDEGEIRLAVAHTDKVVVVKFGKPIAWIAMEPASVRKLAALLIEHADQCPNPG